MAGIENLGSEISAIRGRAATIARVFDRTLIPMVLVDNRRAYREANRASRLFTRLSLAEIRRHRIDDFTPAGLLPQMGRYWEELLGTGSVAGNYVFAMADGHQVPIVFSALANMLPGLHLILYIPSSWSEDELGPLESESHKPLDGPISRREREVLACVAAGNDLHQIAEALTLSPNTVKTHLRNAIRKLGARNRAHAVALAMQQGLV